jgi:hypothetical protein
MDAADAARDRRREGRSGSADWSVIEIGSNPGTGKKEELMGKNPDVDENNVIRMSLTSAEIDVADEAAADLEAADGNSSSGTQRQVSASGSWRSSILKAQSSSSSTGT